MTKLQKVTKFIANDGTEFNTAAEAKEYNKAAVEAARANEVFNKLMEDESVTSIHAPELHTIEDLVNFLAINVDVLKKALIAAAVQRRGPRKAKEEDQAAA